MLLWFSRSKSESRARKWSQMEDEVLEAAGMHLQLPMTNVRESGLATAALLVFLLARCGGGSLDAFLGFQFKV